MNRRVFAKLSAAALGLPALAAAERLPLAARDPAKGDSGAAAGSLLTPVEMAQYEKSLPGRAKTFARMEAVAIPFSIEPDFVFRAAVSKLPARPRGRR